MTSIDKLIYDELAGRRSVTMPGVGTLEVKRRGAKKLSDTQIIPPQNVVVFTPDEPDGVQSVIALAIAAGMSEDEAVALYGSWLVDARRPDGSIAIEEVGEVANGGVVVTERLHTVLNPNYEDIITMETERSSTPLWAWIVIAVLAALLIFGVLWCWKQGVFDGGKKSAPVETVVVTTPIPTPVQDSLAAAEEARVAAAAAEAAAVPAGPRYHVIGGAFAIESNADKFIEKLKRQHPELTAEKIVNPRSGYQMVSIFQTPSRREANNKMNLYWDVDLFLWIYEQK